MQKAKVLFDFTAQADNQLNLKVGQVISIVSHGGKGAWSKGADELTGCKTIFLC
jgi:hypothetical protein